MSAWISGFRLQQAVRSLRNGGVVIYPTEGVYGLGCDPFNPIAVQSLLRIKQRSASKGFILIASALSEIEEFIHWPKVADANALRASWPGPTTWVVPATHNTPDWLTGTHKASLAIRVTDHPIAAALCKAWGGPLVSTSANPSGKKPVRSIVRARKHFAKAPLYWVPGRLGSLQKPTPIYNAVDKMRLR